MTRQLLTDQMRRRLVAAREAKGWTVKDLAQRLHWGSLFLQDMECGAYVPRDPQTVTRWCEALGLTLKVEIE